MTAGTIAPQPFPLDRVVDALTRGDGFAYSRWGDGEWSAILGHGTANCDGQLYTPQLRTDLALVLLERPTYHLGLQSLALRRFGDEITQWLTDNRLTLPWVDSSTFHTASIRDQLAPLLTVLDSRGVILVGPHRLQQAPLRIIDHAVLPADPLDYGHLQALDRLISTMASRGTTPVIAFSAGMMSNVLIHSLHKRHPDHAMVDFGSVWEPYAGHSNRTYHAKIRARLTTKESAA